MGGSVGAGLREVLVFFFWSCGTVPWVIDFKEDDWFCSWFHTHGDLVLRVCDGGEGSFREDRKQREPGRSQGKVHPLEVLPLALFPTTSS